MFVSQQNESSQNLFNDFLISYKMKWLPHYTENVLDDRTGSDENKIWGPFLSGLDKELDSDKDFERS